MERKCELCGKFFEGRGRWCSEKCYQHSYYMNTLKNRKDYKYKYYIDNKDKISKQCKQYYEKNKDKILTRNKQYYEENKDKISVRNKQYYEEHRDYAIEKSKKWHKNNRDKCNENQRKNYWKKKNQGLQHLKIDGKLQWFKERPKVYCSICGKEIENVKHGNTKHCKECNKELHRERSRIRYQHLKERGM